VRYDLFGIVLVVLLIVLCAALGAAAHQRDAARARTRAICLDVVAGLERELLRPDVDSTEAGLVLGAAWQPVRNCVPDLEVDAPFLDALYSGDVRLRRTALERVRLQLEAR